MKNRITSIALITLVLLACSSDDGVTFSGITMMDEFANQVGEPDVTDWGIDEVWSEVELSLFPNIESSELNNGGAAIDLSIFQELPSVTPAYPNPTGGNFSFTQFDIDFESAEIIFVNSNYEILLGPFDLQPNSGLTFELEVQSSIASMFFQQTTPIGGNGPKIQSGQIVRMYYYFKMIDSDVYIKGHGDILFQ